MCGRLRKNQSLQPGGYTIIKNSKGTQVVMFGLNYGSNYNARWETIEHTWKTLNKNRGILDIEGFWEGNGYFERTDGGKFHIGVILNDKSEFAIITKKPNLVVKEYYHRMPLCIRQSGVSEFLEGSIDIKELDNGLFTVQSKIAA